MQRDFKAFVVFAHFFYELTFLINNINFYEETSTNSHVTGFLYDYGFCSKPGYYR